MTLGFALAIQAGMKNLISVHGTAAYGCSVHITTLPHEDFAHGR
jgi:hypothetical protein